MNRRAIALIALSLAVLASPAGCSKPDPTPGAGAPAVDLSPIPAPQGLVAEAFLPSPDATWAKVRIAVSGPAMFLPVSAGGLVANLLGMPITVAQEIDGGVPVLGAVVDSARTAGAAAPLSASAAPQLAPPAAGDRPLAALGVHVKSGERLVDQLTRGEGARFQAKTDAATSIVLLEPKEAPGGKDARRPAMGVLGNYLLVGAEVRDVTAVGPYVARTMPKAEVPKEDLAIEIPRSAIDGPILSAAMDLWKKVGGAGGAADTFAFAPTIESWLGILGDLDRARVTVVLDEAAHLRIAGTPKPGGGAASRAVAEMSVGDVKPLLELPSDALIALVVRESATGRAGGIERQADAVARLAGREVPQKEREQIVAALRAASDARGDWFAAGLRFDSTGPTAYARAAAGDEDKLAKAIADVVELAKLSAIKGFLADEKLRVSSGKTVVERLPGDVRRIRFERVEDKTAGKKGAPPADKDAGASPVPKTIDLLYLLQGGELFASAGYDPQEGLRRAVAAPAGDNLAGAPAIKGALGALGDDVSFALVVDPLRLVARRAGRPDAGEPAPVVLAGGAARGAGGAPASLWVRADVATAAIRELVRYRGAL
jgi:hypothetical protein